MFTLLSIVINKTRNKIGFRPNRMNISSFSSSPGRSFRQYAVLALLAMTISWVAPANSQTTVTNILYEDLFSGSSNLQGWTPDTVDAYGSGTNTWIASGWSMDGTEAVEQSGLDDAFLPFVPLPGRVYTLSVSLQCASGSWVALGFTASDNTTAYFASGLNAVGWQLAGPGAGAGPNTQQTFIGPNTLGQVYADISYPGPFGTYATILDTRPTNTADWTFTFLINGTAVAPAQAFGSSGPVIKYVGMGSGNASDDDEVQDFTLTEQVATQPPLIVTQPQPPAAGTNFPGDIVTLSVAASGYPGPYYQWRLNSTNLPGATNSSLLLGNLEPTNAGFYMVVVSSLSLSVTSTPVSVVVVTPVTNTLYHDEFAGATGPLNGRVPDTVGAPNEWMANPYWTAGNNGTTNAAMATGDAGGPNAFLPFVPIPGQVYVLSAVLDDQAGGDQWLALGYSGADETNGGLNQGITYGWILARDDGDANANQVFVGPGTDGGASLDDFSTGPATYTTILDTRPVVRSQWSFSFKVNGATVLPPTPFGGSGPPVAYVGMGIGAGGADTATAQHFTLTALSEPVAPYLVTSPQGGTYFVGQKVTFSSSAGGALPLAYQWQMNSNNIPGATGSSLTFSNLVLTNAGDYQLIVNNALGSTTSSPVWLLVSNAPTVVDASSNLVLHLTFTGSFLDSSGRGNNATSVGSSLQPGIVGGAMTYGSTASGSDLGYATLGTPSDLLFSNNVNFTVSYWIQYTNVADNELDGAYPPYAFPDCDLPIIGNAVGATYQPGWVIAQGGEGCEGNPGAFIWTLNDTSYTVAAAGPAHSEDDGNWHHLAHVFDWGQGFGTTYLDGVEVDATDIQGIRTVDQTNSITIGQDPTGTYTSPGAGNLSDFAIWRRALSGNEVRSIYEAGASNRVSIASQPLPLAAAVSGGQLRVRWFTGILQQAGSLTGPWTTVTNASTPAYTVPVTASRQFYRAVQ